MESWRQYLKEDSVEEMTISQLMTIVSKQSARGKLEKMVSSDGAKYLAQATAAAVGLGMTGGSDAGLTGGALAALAGAGMDKLTNKLRKSLPKMLVSLKDLPDTQTQGTAFEYFDMDDEAQALARGGVKVDGPLLIKFSDWLEDKYEASFGSAAPETKLSELNIKSANEYFNEFLETEATGFAGAMDLKVNINRKIVNP